METQELFNLFQEKGYKVTSQRLAIYKLVKSRKDHPSTDQIYQEIKNKYPTISLGTIYKTLHLFKNLGLIQELSFDENIVRYEPNTDLHINIVCSKCGKIRDYKGENLKNLWDTIVSDIGIKPEGQRIDLYYECEDCK